MAVAALPAPLVSAGRSTKLAFCYTSGASPRAATAADCPAPPPPSPEHVAIDISAAADTLPVVVVVVLEGVPPTPPQPEHAAIDIPAAAVKLPVDGGKNPTRAGAFVRALVKGLCAAYMLMVAPALVVAALIFGPSPFVQLMVFFAGMFTAAVFLVRKAEKEKEQAPMEVEA